MAEIRHNGGIVSAYLELGFDQVKYFEGTISPTATGFTISPPARRLTVNNRSETNDVFLRINDSPAIASVSFTPGDDIKIGALASFVMDFDALHEVSFVANTGETVDIEGLIGFKGVVG